ncbi:MAG: 5'-methylthioadenosine/adenosylhomocysteine nucleosidase [Selenomonadaceae bacterium]|nr:5'-methylthioadenosine/adenosylhomocysteine nucleosidase [Selenomonadaceae bacterium]
MKIGIIGAMKSEVALLKSAMTDIKPYSKAGMEFFVGKLGATDVVVAQCGIGKVNAAVCTQILIDDCAVTHIINTGVAGSLTAKLSIGDMVVSSDAVQHDYSVAPIGFRKGEIPFTGCVGFPADEELRQKALKSIAQNLPQVKALSGRVCSGDQFIASKAEKERIIAEFDGACVEMEGAAIAQVCFLNKIPFVILRAISDDAEDGGHMTFEEFEALAAANSAKVVQGML